MATTCLRLLLVEDSDSDAFLAAEMIREGSQGAPVQVDRASSAAEALERLERNSYDVLFFDYRLGAQDGVSLLRHVRARQVQTPVVFLTGKGDDATAVEAMKAGAADYLSKARLSPDSIWSCIRHAVGVRHEQVRRQAAEDRLRRSEAKLAEAQRIAHMGSWEWDIAADKVTWSDELYRIYGLRPHESPATFEAYLARLHPEDRDLHQETIERTLRTHQPFQSEYRIRRPDGAGRWVHARGAVVTAADGTAERMMGTCQDITERKTAELELRQSMGQVRRAQKMEAIGRLAGGIAHDFSDVMTGILGYGQLLLGRLERDSGLRAEVEQIRKVALRGASLTRQLLAFSREQITTPRAIDLNVVLTDLAPTLRSLIGEHIQLRHALEPGLRSIRADRGLIEQAVLNLALFARDSMPKGGTLTLETRNADLDKESAKKHFPAQPGPHVLLSVGDDGSGIDPVALPHIFEPFYATKERDEGTGLDLATVYGIVHQCDGSISAFSEPGRGTTFLMHFPRTNEPPDTRVVSATPVSSLHGTETLLLVEDDDAVRAVCAEVLKEHGYTVLEAASGADALRLASAHPGAVHLLIADVIMPSMNGRQLANRFEQTRPGTKVLFISGYAGRVTELLGVLTPTRAVFHKPFTPEALARRTREFLDQAPASPPSA
ncbi:MAG: response regulator [Planctomycetes bacterium]|nr:response regulator [Planctomycetota bacterium]